MVFNNQVKGSIAGLVAAVTYGMNPLFGIHLYQEGMLVPSVLFYRLLFASGMLGVWMLCIGAAFRVPKRIIPLLTGEAILLALTCFCWFQSFKLMDSGIAATLLFLHPIMTALILFFGFHEKITLRTLICSAFALVGVGFLCWPAGGNFRINAPGVIFVLISAFTYAVYMVALKVSRLRELSSETLTFYTLFGASICFLFYLRGGINLQMLPSWRALGNLAGLAFFPSFLAFFLLAVSIRLIGPTKTAIFGALEPLTAVILGVTLLGEPFTPQLFWGMALILVSVSFIITSNPQEQETAKDCRA